MGHHHSNTRMRRWQNPEFNWCSDHPGRLESLGVRQLGRCGNVLDAIHGVASKMKKRDTAKFYPTLAVGAI